MTGRPRSTRRLAVPALLLALLVPARTIALCCLGDTGPATPAGAHATHGPTSHHRSAGEPAPVGSGLGLAAESECVVLTTFAPALRERGRSCDTGPEGGDPALMPIAQLRDFGPPGCLVPRWVTPVSLPHAVEDFHPLRL